MPARTAAQAIHELVAPWQQAVSCVTRGVLLQERGAERATEGALYLTDQAGRLRGATVLSLSIAVTYTTTRDSVGSRDWAARLTSYRYLLRLPSGRQLLAYHWHPVGRSPIVTPHLHLRSHPAPVDLTHAHLPTGPVTLSAVLRCAIAELGVEPLRADWEHVLAPLEAPLPVAEG